MAKILRGDSESLDLLKLQGEVGLYLYRFPKKNGGWTIKFGKSETDLYKRLIGQAVLRNGDDWIAFVDRNPQLETITLKYFRALFPTNVYIAKSVYRRETFVVDNFNIIEDFIKDTENLSDDDYQKYCEMRYKHSSSDIIRYNNLIHKAKKPKLIEYLLYQETDGIFGEDIRIYEFCKWLEEGVICDEDLELLIKGDDDFKTYGIYVDHFGLDKCLSILKSWRGSKILKEEYQKDVTKSLFGGKFDRGKAYNKALVLHIIDEVIKSSGNVNKFTIGDLLDCGILRCKDYWNFEVPD